MEVLINQIKAVASFLIAAETKTLAFQQWGKNNPAFAKAFIKIQTQFDEIFKLRAHALLALNSKRHLNENELARLYYDKWMNALKALPHEVNLRQMLSTDNHLKHRLEEQIIPLLTPIINSFTEYQQDLNSHHSYLQQRLTKVIEDMCGYERNLFKGMIKDLPKLNVIDKFETTLIRCVTVLCKEMVGIADIQMQLIDTIDIVVDSFQQIELEAMDVNKYAVHLGITMKNMLLMLLATMNAGSIKSQNITMVSDERVQPTAPLAVGSYQHGNAVPASSLLDS